MTFPGLHHFAASLRKQGLKSCCGLVWFFLACVCGAAGAEVTKEYRIKAGCLRYFTKFVEWPSSSFSTTNAPMVIGVFGRNPFGDELEIEIKDLQVNGHPVVCKPVARASDARLVHLLFVPANEESSLNELVKELQQAHVLTVGETPGFAAAGGMINFLREGDKVRFDINAFSADQAGLRISAQLQKLAKTVRKKN